MRVPLTVPLRRSPQRPWLERVAEHRKGAYDKTTEQESDGQFAHRLSFSIEHRGCVLNPEGGFARQDLSGLWLAWQATIGDSAVCPEV